MNGLLLRKQSPGAMSSNSSGIGAMAMFDVRTWTGIPWAMLTNRILLSEMDADRSRACSTDERALWRHACMDSRTMPSSLFTSVANTTGSSF